MLKPMQLSPFPKAIKDFQPGIFGMGHKFYCHQSWLKNMVLVLEVQSKNACCQWWWAVSMHKTIFVGYVSNYYWVIPRRKMNLQKDELREDKSQGCKGNHHRCCATHQPFYRLNSTSLNVQLFQGQVCTSVLSCQLHLTDENYPAGS